MGTEAPKMSLGEALDTMSDCVGDEHTKEAMDVIYEYISELESGWVAAQALIDKYKGKLSKIG